MNKLFITRRSLIFISSFVALCACLVIFMPKSASALSLNPNPGSTIPWGNGDYLRNCDNPAINTTGQTPGVTQWVSPASNTGVKSMTVAYGTPAVSLRANMAGVICFTYSNTQTLKGKFNTTSPEISGLDNATVHVDWSPTPTTVGTYRHSSTVFTYRPAGGFTRSGTYHIGGEFRAINEGLGSAFFQCVGGRENYVDHIDDWQCDPAGFGFDIYVTVEKRPPTGWIDGASCDLNTTNPAYATGWVWDPDSPPGHVPNVRIWADATTPALGGRIVGSGPANIVRSDLGAYPGARGFRIDISAFKDAYRHNLFAVVTNSNGENRATLLSGSQRAGPCALPRCGTYSSTPSRPEAGAPFSARATYNYSPGSQGWALNGDMGLDINSIRRNTITFHSPAGVANWNGTPIPPGANRTNQVGASGIIIPTPGTYTVGWPMQWLIFGNDNVLKDFLRNTGGGYNWYTAGNGNTYATLVCPSQGPINPIVVSMPYMRVSGNDVQAGGGLKPSCTPTNNRATILTYARSIGSNDNGETWQGSGTQFAAFALGEVANFMSAAQSGPRQNSTSGPAGNSQARPVLDLTFGNYNPTYAILNFFPGANTAILDTRKVEGFGGLSGMASCVENYYQAVSTGGGSPVTSPLGSKTINGAVAEYHDGDLIINGNIDFPASWSESTTPSYYLVVRGNIYIQGNVDRLSGVYIAQDNGTGTKGRIYTCANGTNLYAGTQLYDACRRRLTVNGAFVAKQIKFLRTIDTLNNGVPNETAANSRAAEVFNFSPETYMANPHPALGTGSRKVQYDFITSLPPIL